MIKLNLVVLVTYFSLMAKNKKPSQKDIEAYIKFLEKALASENFKKNKPVEYEKYKEKLAKERLKLKLLFNK